MSVEAMDFCLVCGGRVSEKSRVCMSCGLDYASTILDAEPTFSTVSHSYPEFQNLPKIYQHAIDLARAMVDGFELIQPRVEKIISLALAKGLFTQGRRAEVSICAASIIACEQFKESLGVKYEPILEELTSWIRNLGITRNQLLNTVSDFQQIIKEKEYLRKKTSPTFTDGDRWLLRKLKHISHVRRLSTNDF